MKIETKIDRERQRKALITYKGKVVQDEAIQRNATVGFDCAPWRVKLVCEMADSTTFECMIFEDGSHSLPEPKGLADMDNEAAILYSKVLAILGAQ